MKPFLITGLPRTRTAWWSVVATGPWSICLHEPSALCNSLPELIALWNKGDVAYSGIADSALIFQMGPIMEMVKPRTLLIKRDVDEVQASLVKAFKGYPVNEEAGLAYIKECAAQFERWESHPLVKVVDFKDLHDIKTVEDCLSWLMPSGRYEFKRELMHINVQVDAGYSMSQAGHSQWYRQ